MLDDGWKTSGEFKVRESIGGGTEERVTVRTGHLPEERGESVERVGRDCLEFVGVHDVSSIRTGCPWFLQKPRNPTARLEDTPREGRAERRDVLTGRASGLLLARSEAAGERRGVFSLARRASRSGAYADDPWSRVHERHNAVIGLGMTPLVRGEQDSQATCTWRRHFDRGNRL